MDTLPRDVFLYLLSFLGPADLLTCTVVSRQWHKCCHDDRLWQVFADRLSVPCFKKLVEQGKGHLWNTIARLFVRRILVEGFSVLNDEQDDYALLRQLLFVVTMGKSCFSLALPAAPILYVDIYDNGFNLSGIQLVPLGQFTMVMFFEGRVLVVLSDEKILISSMDYPDYGTNFNWRSALKDAFVSGFLF